MMAEVQQDRSALRWIRGELDQTLRDARASLEDFIDGQHERLQTGIDRLHHVHGALELVQVYGGAMLADEMEQLALALFHGQVKQLEAAAEALMLGMVQLPAYLEKVESGGADVPLVLLPLMNDLRAARDASLVSETALFAPKLNAVIAAETVRPGSGNRDLPRLLNQQRSQYHRALLHWIRGEHADAALGQIRDVLDRLNTAAGTARLRRLLDAAEALTVVLAEDDPAAALAVKPLFGKLDRVFKKIIDQGEEVSMLDFPVELLKNMLYHIARSDSRNPVVTAVRQTADLANAFVDPAQETLAVGTLGAPDRELFRAVGEALAQDLRDVKDQLDLFMRSDRSQLARLTALAKPVQRIGDTLGMVGRGDLRARLKRRCEELSAAERSGEPLAEERLMILAGDLLFVESALASLGSPAAADGGPSVDGTDSQLLSEEELQRHQRAAVDEALVELARTKESMLQFIEQPDRREPLVEVPARLHMVAGVMHLLGLPEAGRLLAALKPYVVALADGRQAPPDAAQGDALADVIVSTELYMQGALEPAANHDRLLEYAEAALERLGLHPSDSVSAASAGETGAQPQPAVAEVIEFVRPAVTADTVVEHAEEPAELTHGPDAAEAPVAHEAVADAAAQAEPIPETPAVEPPAAPVLADVDSEIIEVFGEEADEELQVIQDCFPRWRANVDDRESLQTMRRSFHTLKGSGRIVGALNIGEFAWSVENLLNRVIDGTVAASADLLQLMDDAVGVLPTLVAESRDPGAVGTDVSAVVARAFALASGEAAAAPAVTMVTGAVEERPAEIEPVVPEAAVQTTDIDTAAPSEVASLAGEDRGPATASDESSPALGVVADTSASDTAWQREALAGDESILTEGELQDSEFSDLEYGANLPDSSLNAVFLSEVESHLAVLADFIAHCHEQADACVFDEGVRRAMHTLRGSSRTTGIESMAEVAGALEALGNAMCDAQRRVDESMLALLERSHGMLTELAGTVEDPHREVAGWASLSEEIRSAADAQRHAPAEVIPADEGATAGVDALDPELLEVFLEEARELLESLETELGDWQYATAGDRGPVARLQRTLHTMKGGARLAGVMAVGNLSHALESAFESVVEGRIDGDARLKGLVRHATDILAQDIDVLQRGQMPGAHGAVIERLEAAAHGREWRDIEADEALIDVGSELVEPAAPVAVPAPQDLAVDSMAGLPVETAAATGDEVLELADLGIDEPPAVQAAAMVEPEPEPEHEPEFVSEPEQQDQRVPQAAAVPGDIENELGDDFEDSELLTDSQLMTDSELLGDSSFLVGGATLVPEAGPIGAVVSTDSKVVQFPSGDQLLEGEGFVPRRPLPQDEPAPAGGSERVRVSSESLDQMVNNAGEVSIYRARIEQQNSSFAFNLGELRQTIDRLRSQLRDLELETEAQILSRHEREGEARADFDPLELDRYSTMQQLSRALSETVEDLSNLGQSLTDLSRDTDTLLLQQARVTTDLQDSLLRTRMVKFASRVPRLERVVRQTSHGIGKQANLKVVGGEEDMDRAILERMMSPLEHLLRNAVSHGIEDANTRLANGKSAQGQITLQLAREGSDVVLTLADDGAGLDRARIRAKAVERGLLEADAVVDDDDLYQLILQHGFSTAQELSQVSGRGVGMDVVLTEVKQLGGTLEIDSQPGRGTSFTVRLPFTLAITDSLLVTLGEDIYAVPHSSMDGVVRIAVDDLRAIYAGERAAFRYGDRDYQVRYLGSMLGTQAPHLSEGLRWLPLLLVRSGEHRVAIQVDGLLGNRQIVVKSVGAQLSTVRWFTGGTILADGQIALILDVNSLVRIDSTQPVAQSLAVEEPVSKGVSVMVVDDSITVRKVTSRLLERHNMHVITAKDGVDAVTLLQEHRPDVMLLDIEMPRMDGYELARHMRSTPELSDIPIIMITSRTGDKHRNRAMELGVRRYLGKPYQEADLLENIYTVLADAAS